jgi:hypothetical protein
MTDTGTGNDTLHDRDFYAWANEQAALLRAGRLEQADIANLAEEVATLATAERRHLVELVSGLLVSLLRWEFEPDQRSAHCRSLIDSQRFAIADHLRESPSLRSAVDEVLPRTYRMAARRAEHESGHAPYRAACPYGADLLLDSAFFPD